MATVEHRETMCFAQSHTANLRNGGQVFLIGPPGVTSCTLSPKGAGVNTKTVTSVALEAMLPKTVLSSAYHSVEWA